MSTKNKLVLTKNGCKILILNCDFKRYLQIEQKQNVNYPKTIELSNMGTFTLKSHLRHKKHKDLIESKKKTSGSFFERKKPVSSSDKHNASDMNDIDSHVAKESVIKAEIIWVLKNIMSGFLLRSCDGISDCFKKMFPDSKSVNKFSLARTKCSYVIAYGIAPCFASLLLEVIKHNDNFSISFDEPLNSVTANKQMDIVITFLDKLNSEVEV